MVIYVLSSGEDHEGGSVVSIHKTFEGARQAFIKWLNVQEWPEIYDQNGCKLVAHKGCGDWLEIWPWTLAE